MEADKLTTPEGLQVQVIAVEKEANLETVYNIEVADFHTYFVGDSQVLVHNDDCEILQIQHVRKDGSIVSFNYERSGNVAVQYGVDAETGVIRSVSAETMAAARSRVNAQQALATEHGIPGLNSALPTNGSTKLSPNFYI